MKANFLGVMLLASLTLAVGATSASAQDRVLPSFGIRPTQADPDSPETFSYFVHTLEPGAIFTDEALVLNEGDTSITLKLYTADGLTAQNGGTAFTAQGELSTGGSRGVNAWLSVPVGEIVLGAGEETIVSFTINVPVDASPGHHIAGLVVEAPPSTANADSTGEGETQFAVAIVQRVGVAVVIEVPGPRNSGLEISDLTLIQQDEQGGTFAIGIHNTGNVILQGQGLLEIFGANDEKLASVPWEMDSVLPGDETTLQFTYPIQLSDGDYLVNVAVRYDEGKIATLQGVEIRVRNGQPTSGAEEVGEPLVPNVIELSSPGGENGANGVRVRSNWLLVAILTPLIVGLIIFEIFIWRKFRQG